MSRSLSYRATVINTMVTVISIIVGLAGIVMAAVAR
jgi:hypothetical protein